MKSSTPISPLDWAETLWRNLEEYDLISFPDEPENLESTRWFLHHYFNEEHWDLEVYETYRHWKVPYKPTDVIHLICFEKTDELIRFVSFQSGKELTLERNEVIEYRTWCRDEGKFFRKGRL